MWICHCCSAGSGLMGSFLIIFSAVYFLKCFIPNLWALIRDAISDAYIKSSQRQNDEKLKKGFSSWEKLGDSMNYMNYFQ